MTRRIDWAVASAVAAAGAAFAALSAPSALPAFLPLGAYPTYDAGTSPLFALVEPVVHASWFGAASAPAAAAVAGFVLCALWATGRSAGASVVAATATTAAFAARPDLGLPLALGAGPLMAVALAWISVGASAGNDASRVRLMLGAVGAGAALAVWPPLIVLLPVLVGAGARGSGAAVVVTTAALVGLGAGLQWWAVRASTLAGEVVSWTDVWTVVSASTSRGVDPFPWPPLTSALLPAVLAVTGAAVLWQASTHKGRWLAAAAVAVMTAATVVSAPHAWRAEAVRAAYWTSWPLAAVGLTWLVSRAPRAGRMAAMAAMACVLVGSGLVAHVKEVETEEPRAFAAALAHVLPPALGRGGAVVVEDTRVDTALVAWGSGHARLARVRRDPALVAAAVARGRVVLAGPSARSALELWGFRFRPGAAVVTPTRFALAKVTGRFACSPVSAQWRVLTGLDLTGRLGLHVPAGPGRLEVEVAGASPASVRAATADGQPVGRVTSGPGAGVISAPTVTRFELEAIADGAGDASLALNAREPLVAARFVDGAGPATICAAPLPRLDPFDEAGGDTATIALDDDVFFAAGWHQAEGLGAGAFRWTTGRALILVPSAGTHAVTLAIDARPAARSVDGAVRLRLAVNGAVVGEEAMTDTTQTYTWNVPASVWADGTNELALEVSRVAAPAASGADPRELGVAVSAIRLRR